MKSPLMTFKESKQFLFLSIHIDDGYYYHYYVCFDVTFFVGL